MTAPGVIGAPVDVRVWIREASVAIDRIYGPQAQLPKESAAVDAALAELIEAARAMAGVQVNRRPTMRNDMGSAKKTRLRAALARVGGAS